MPKLSLAILAQSVCQNQSLHLTYFGWCLWDVAWLWACRKLAPSYRREGKRSLFGIGISVVFFFLPHLAQWFLPDNPLSKLPQHRLSRRLRVSVHINQVLTVKKQKVLAVLSLWCVECANFCFAMVNYTFLSRYNAEMCGQKSVIAHIAVRY